MAAENIKVKDGALPCKYLGILIGANMNQLKHWKEVIDACKARLSTWKAKTLSMGGRVVLLKSVLDSLPLYYFSLFKAPKGVLEQLEMLRKRFFWGGNDEKRKMAWVCWDRVIGPTEKGGIGLGSLEHMNWGLLVKWWWRYKTEPAALWRTTITAIHHSPRTWSYLPIKSSMTGVWNAILKINKELTDRNFEITGLIKGGLGDGRSIRFWLDRWVGDEPLMAKFPKLFVLETSKSCTVAERLQRVGHLWVGNWAWKRNLMTIEEHDERLLLQQWIQETTLSNEKDTWKWELEPDGNFTVASCRKTLSNSATPYYPYEWSRWVPKKVNLMAWRAEQNRLPTLRNLVRRNIGLNSTCCRLCGEGDETAEHLFQDCFIAANIWNKVSEWCNIQPIFSFCFKDLLGIHKARGLNRLKRKAIHAVILTTCWILWKTRNDKVFNGRDAILENMMSNIKATSYTWVKSRAKQHTIEWKSWIKFELN